MYVNRYALEKLTEFLKATVEAGGLVPGESTFNIKVGQMEGPKELKASAISMARAALMKAGYILKVGTILDGLGKLSPAFGSDTLDEIVKFTIEAAQDDAPSRPPPSPFDTPEPEPEEVKVNIYELVDLLDYEERLALLARVMTTITVRPALLEGQLENALAEAGRRENEIANLREELKTVKVQLQASREELNRERSQIAPRTVERYVTVSTKPIPKGMEHGATSGAAPGDMMLHRRPLMQHPPKGVLRKRDK